MERTMTEAKIRIENLFKIFGTNPSSVLDHVRNGMSKTELLEKHNHVLGLNNNNITIPERGISVIMGLSGSGKSTLIRHINRLIEPTAGKIWYENEDVLAMSKAQLRDFRRYKASMVFQKFGLHVHKTVADNVAYGLVIQGQSLKDARSNSAKWLERVGLAGFENHYPVQLSGGRQQSVGLARALATDAEILLMDEAFSALDPLIRTDMQDVLLKLQDELHKTIVFITHDLDEALRIGDTIAILRDGAVIQQGDPQDIILQPADNYIVDFIRDINRGRVIQVRSLMTEGPRIDGPDLHSRVVLEEALGPIAKSPGQAANVVDQGGTQLGVISLEKIIAGLSRPDDQDTGDARYR